MVAVWRTRLALPNDLGLIRTSVLLIVVLWESMLRPLLSRDLPAKNEVDPVASAASAAATTWRCLQGTKAYRLRR